MPKGTNGNFDTVDHARHHLERTNCRFHDSRLDPDRTIVEVWRDEVNDVVVVIAPPQGRASVVWTHSETVPDWVFPAGKEVTA